MQEVRDAGKTRFIGISSTEPHIETFITWVSSIIPDPYSALERTHEAAISSAARSGAGTIIRGGVARGEPGAGLGAQDRWQAWEKAKMRELLEPGESRTSFILRFHALAPRHGHDHRRDQEPGAPEREPGRRSEGALKPEVYEEAKKRLAPA